MQMACSDVKGSTVAKGLVLALVLIVGLGVGIAIAYGIFGGDGGVGNHIALLDAFAFLSFSW